MKTAIKILVLLVVSVCTYPGLLAQNAKTITVFGNAEKVVEPDEVCLSLTLQEYSNDAGTKMVISQLETELTNAMKSAGIPAGNILVENINGYGNYGGYEAPDFMISKMYQVRLPNLDAAGKLLAKMGQGLVNANVLNFNSSKSKSLMSELKAEAMQNAKEEAEALVKLAGKKLGDIVNIEVVQDYSTVYGIDAYAPFYGPIPAGSAGKVSVKPITLRYNLKVEYAIQ